MNGNLSIELAYQHQQELVDYATRTRLAGSSSGHRPLLARWRGHRAARNAPTESLPTTLTPAGCSSH